LQVTSPRSVLLKLSSLGAGAGGDVGGRHIRQSVNLQDLYATRRPYETRGLTPD